jgi:hypothetical protein
MIEYITLRLHGTTQRRKALISLAGRFVLRPVSSLTSVQCCVSTTVL